jgi:hypothetical protein
MHRLADCILEYRNAMFKSDTLFSTSNSTPGVLIVHSKGPTQLVALLVIVFGICGGTSRSSEMKESGVFSNVARPILVVS